MPTAIRCTCAAHRRTGLYFVGLRWQSQRSSSFLDGVAVDAEHVATRVADELREPAAA